MLHAATANLKRIPMSWRRRSLAAAYANAALWGLGSGLASTTLVTYLARAHGAAGLGISAILAAPSLVGLLRLATPAWLGRVASRRRFCIAMFLASAAVLAMLPLLSALSAVSSSRGAIAVLTATWAGYQLFEYIAVVALWSWLGDLVPRRVRGRFLGRREAWLNAGTVAGTVIAIAITIAWKWRAAGEVVPTLDRQAYAICTLAGAAAIALAALVLGRVADLPSVRRTPAARGLRFGDFVAPLVDPHYRRFMAFGVWFSASNGIVQAAQALFPIAALNLPFAAKRTLDGGLRVGKVLVLPRVGQAVDVRGAVPVLAMSQGVIALAPLFFLYATPAAPWWIVGAYACWLAYAGHDVALPKLMLDASPQEAKAAYAAAWFAWTQLVYSLSVLAGGVLFDWMNYRYLPRTLGGRAFDLYALFFVASWLLKTAGVAFAARIAARPAPTISPAVGNVGAA